MANDSNEKIKWASNWILIDLYSIFRKGRINETASFM